MRASFRINIEPSFIIGSAVNRMDVYDGDVDDSGDDKWMNAK